MRAIVTVLGKDDVGILSFISALLAEHQVSVLDISQTIMREYFTMVMLVDCAKVELPFAELVDIDKEIDRLEKEEAKLEKELARSRGMLGNEKFVSRAPEAKIQEEKAKLEKYEQMMAQVKERLNQLKK